MASELPSDDRRDDELVARMREGDREAFAGLFAKHQATVYRFARQMGVDRETAEDITQDVFVSLVHAGARFDPHLGALGTYLYGIARNLVRQRAKRTGTRAEVDVESVLGQNERLLASWTDPAREFERREALASLRRALAALPFRHREVIVLCDLHELSYETAAEIVGCPVGTIRSRLNRARSALIRRCRAALALSSSEETEPSKAAPVVGVDVL